VSEKKARARRRALRRSQDGSRLQRKLRGVERSEREQELDVQTRMARIERDEQIVEAQKDARKKHEAVEADLKKAVRKAEAEYVERRNAIIRKLAPAEEKAA
jgi:hypothetical protein